MTRMETRGEQLARKAPKAWCEPDQSRTDLWHNGTAQPPEDNPWTPLWVGVGLSGALLVIVGALVLVGA